MNAGVVTFSALTVSNDGIMNIIIRLKIYSLLKTQLILLSASVCRKGKAADARQLLSISRSWQEYVVLTRCKEKSP